MRKTSADARDIAALGADASNVASVDVILSEIKKRFLRERNRKLGKVGGAVSEIALESLAAFPTANPKFPVRKE